MGKNFVFPSQVGVEALGTNKGKWILCPTTLQPQSNMGNCNFFQILFCLLNFWNKIHFKTSVAAGANNWGWKQKRGL